MSEPWDEGWRLFVTDRDGQQTKFPKAYKWEVDSDSHALILADINSAWLAVYAPGEWRFIGRYQQGTDDTEVPF